MDADDREAADERPRILKIMTGWVGGLTGLVVAAAALWSAVQGFDRSRRSEAVVPVSSDVKTEAGTEANSVGAGPVEAVELPSVYESDDGRTFDGTGEYWLETVGHTVRQFTEESRTDGMTLIWDDEVYLHWPNGGGRVQSSTDGKIWIDTTYKVFPRKAAAAG